MKKIISSKLPTVFFFLLLVPHVLVSQEWFPVGAKWTYSVTYPIADSESNKNGVSYMECVKDTTINGINAKLIISEDICSSNYPENIFYYEPETDILYYYVDSIFRTYYDFSKNAGESYYLYFPSFDSHHSDYDSLLLIVDSVVIKSFAGIDIRHQYVTSTNSEYQIKSPFIEYVGIFLFPVYGGCDFDWLTDLRCYHDNTFHYYANPIYEEKGCDIALSVKELTPEMDVAIFPNPTSDNFTISITNNYMPLAYELFDIHGKLLMQGNYSPAHPKVDVSHLHSGIYFIRLMNERKTFSIEKLIKK